MGRDIDLSNAGKYGLSLEDRLRTFYEHAAYQIARVITTNPLPTGSGKL